MDSASLYDPQMSWRSATRIAACGGWSSRLSLGGRGEPGRPGSRTWRIGDAMSDLQLTLEEKSSFIDTVGRWVLRVAVALLFFALGASKFGSHSLWVRLFEQIGFGPWFRVFTGAVQTGGALMLLVPRLAWMGAAILTCTMFGAILAQLFIVHAFLLAISPAILMVITAAVGAQARDWL